MTTHHATTTGDRSGGYQACPVCGCAPCRWDGLYPDTQHAPQPTEHDHKCIRDDQRCMVASPDRGPDILTVDSWQARGLACYVCRHHFTSTDQVVPTNLRVTYGLDNRRSYENYPYYLARHANCAWPYWPCGCPFEYRYR